MQREPNLRMRIAVLGLIIGLVVSVGAILILIRILVGLVR